MADLATEYLGLRLVHNPEFLTAKAAFQDFMRQETILLSGPVNDCLDVVSVYRDVLPRAKYMLEEEYEVSELAKYMSNCFLAAKVSWMNEFRELCESMSVDYEQVRAFALSQGLIGENHTQAPGPDGKRGWGSACFPKDMLALHTKAKRLGLDMRMLEATLKTNEKYRKFDNYCKEIQS
jgi:UDPglucose 6-dehydrogenase